MTMLNETTAKETTYRFDADKEKYLIMRLNGQLFGILADSVEDVLLPQRISPVPLASAEIKGLLNLRGRIVTVIDIAVKLALSSKEERSEKVIRNVVVEYKGDLYSFIVDEVSEVMGINGSKIASTPDNLSEAWKDVSKGVFSLEKELMVILDIEKLLYTDEIKEDEVI